MKLKKAELGDSFDRIKAFSSKRVTHGAVAYSDMPCIEFTSLFKHQVVTTINPAHELPWSVPEWLAKAEAQSEKNSNDLKRILFERSFACQEALREDFNKYNADPNYEEKETAKDVAWIEKRFRAKT